MKISQTGLDLIKSSEGCKLKSYRCSANVLTIGYGHTGEDVFESQEITQADAEALLRFDIARYENGVNRTCPKMTQPQFDASVSLCYNIGEQAFSKSSVARLHNAGKYGEAAQAFMLWNKAAKKVSRGLAARRAKESALYLSDQFDESYVPPSEAEGEKPLSASRSINGQVGGVIATAGTVAASQVDTSTITENSGLILQFLPYLKEYWWVLCAIGAAFFIYSMWARVSDRLQGRA